MKKFLLALVLSLVTLTASAQYFLPTNTPTTNLNGTSYTANMLNISGVISIDVLAAFKTVPGGWTPIGSFIAVYSNPPRR